LGRDDTTDEVVERIRSWRDRVGADGDTVGLFYFSGHGIQRNKEDAVLMLRDFARSKAAMLEHAISFFERLSGGAKAVDKLCSALGHYSGLVGVTRPILITDLRGMLSTQSVAPAMTVAIELAQGSGAGRLLRNSGPWSNFDGYFGPGVRRPGICDRCPENQIASRSFGGALQSRGHGITVLHVGHVAERESELRLRYSLGEL
jgi:hypothetical protein